MDLATFERRALAYWNAIPARFREGVTAFIVEARAHKKEEFEDGWIYGWCEPDAAVMAIPGAPVTSRITLFHGSFVEIAKDDPDFDWEAELEETVRHELQHHLEWRGGDDDLGDEDDVQDDNERRVTGAPFQPWFHRKGTSLGQGAWLADHTLFVEVAVPKRDWAGLADAPVRHELGGMALVTEPIPAELLEDEPIYAPADVHGVAPEEADAAWPWDEVVLVLYRKTGWWPW